MHFRFSRANAVQLLRDEGTLRPRAEAKHDDDVWSSEEEEQEDDVIIPMPGRTL